MEQVPRSRLLLFLNLCSVVIFRFGFSLSGDGVCISQGYVRLGFLKFLCNPFGSVQKVSNLGKPPASSSLLAGPVLDLLLAHDSQC